VVVLEQAGLVDLVVHLELQDQVVHLVVLEHQAILEHQVLQVLVELQENLAINMLQYQIKLKQFRQVIQLQ